MPELKLSQEELAVICWALSGVVADGDAAKQKGEKPKSLPEYEHAKALLRRIQAEFY